MTIEYDRDKVLGFLSLIYSPSVNVEELGGKISRELNPVELRMLKLYVSVHHWHLTTTKKLMKQN
jgi:hypothetical protein